MFIQVGSRSSTLARAQAQTVVDLLNENSDVRADLTTMESSGDEHQDRAIPDIGETGVFTSRLNRAVVNNDVDAAVHSLKDLPTTIHEELTNVGIPPRNTPMDALVGLDVSSFSALPEGTVIGTSSVRRKANILYKNDELRVKPCRGNVPSRLEKLQDDNSVYDGLVLAMAGLERLEETINPLRMIRPDEMLPAPGQGAIALVCRKDHEELVRQLKRIDHSSSRAVCEAERSFLSTVEGGCQAPVGALAKFSNDELVLKGNVTNPDGTDQVSGTRTGSPEHPRRLGRKLAETMLEWGAGEFIRS